LILPLSGRLRISSTGTGFGLLGGRARLARSNAWVKVLSIAMIELSAPL
jgi:hypothetical protein